MLEAGKPLDPDVGRKAMAYFATIGVTGWFLHRLLQFYILKNSDFGLIYLL